MLKFNLDLILLYFLGYNFDYNADSLDELSIKILRIWPTDEQILQTFNHSQRLARELAEFVGMLQPNNSPINVNLPIVFIDNDNEEISKSASYKQTEELDIAEIEEVETID